MNNRQAALIAAASALRNTMGGDDTRMEQLVKSAQRMKLLIDEWDRCDEAGERLSTWGHISYVETERRREEMLRADANQSVS